MISYLTFVCATLLSLVACFHQPVDENSVTVTAAEKLLVEQTVAFDTTASVVHIFVALCDNRYQEIVPVPEKIGNGQDPGNNLYWGCAFGIKTFFKNSGNWTLIDSRKKLDSVRLERLVFKHKTKNWFLVADAYDGKHIQRCTEDFLSASCGSLKDTVRTNERIIGSAGNAKLIAYIGHNGLMDFQLDKAYPQADGISRDIIVLACYSKSYFSEALKHAKVNPLVWTTGLMCPEAYTIHDALNAYIEKQPAETIRTKAALAYSKYQKCSEKAARNLLATGW